MVLKRMRSNFPTHVGSQFLVVLLCLFPSSVRQAFGEQIAGDYSAKDFVPVKDLDLLSDTTQVEGKPVGTVSADTLRSSSGLINPDSARNQAGAGNSASERGVIFSVENEKPLSKVLVLLSNVEHKYSATSNEAGIYALNGIIPGTYRLKIVKKGFELYEREGVEMSSGQGAAREVHLERSILKGQLIEAKGGGNSGSAAALMATRRSSSGVMEGVSAEQIAKSTDADAGAVAKRLTGTSLVGGKYIYVRGLGERYTNMTLNGLPVPSPEKDKRVVPQDLFPSSALDRFVLFKTFSPDLYADFAGGSVALETKGIPEKRFLKISLGMSGRDFQGDGQFLGFGKDRLTYDGGNTFWGFDDGTRTKPEGVPSNIPIRLDSDIPHYKELGLPAPTREERLAYALSFKNVYAQDTGKVLPNQNYSISLGDVRSLSGNGRAGYILTAGFKNKYEQFNSTQSFLGLVPFTQRIGRYYEILDDTLYVTVPIYDTLPDSTTREVQHLATGIQRDQQNGTYDATLTGLANFGWDINPSQHLFWRNFYVNLGSDRTGRTVSKTVGTSNLNQDKPYEERYLLEFTRRSLYSSQLGGGHYLGVGPADSLGWVTGYSRTQAETPDSRKYLYSRQNDSATTFENYNNDVWGTRIYDDLNENALAGRADFFLSIPPEWSAREIFLLQGKVISHLRLPQAVAGVSGNLRSREFNVTRYSYDKDKNIYENKTLEEIREPGFLKQKIENQIFQADFYTSPKSYDEYTASEGVYTGYLSATTGFSLLKLPLDFDGGVRAEQYALAFKAPYTGDRYGDDVAKIDSAAIRIDEEKLTWLPSLGLTARPYDNGKLHLHYAQTLTRPEIREIAPFEYYDYERSRTIVGNPDLKQTSIRHRDIRWESFFPGQQILSVSIFDKHFEAPIEPVVDDNNCVTFQNSNSAFVEGVEFEGNLDVSSTIGLTGWEPAALQGFSLYGNLAFMKSRVQLDTTPKANVCSDRNQLTSKSRSMVGQSPYLWNLKLSHEMEWRSLGLLNALLFNVNGERIKDVGINGAPDIYEQPFPSLEYLGRATFFKRLEISWSAKNLLNRSIRLRGYETNDPNSYHTLAPATAQALFDTSPRHYDTEVVPQGVSYELKLSYAL